MAQRGKNLPAMQETQETQETWVGCLDQEDPLEEEMASHSSVLAWKTPWTEEPAWLQSMGRKESVGHDWVTNTHTHFITDKES